MIISLISMSLSFVLEDDKCGIMVIQICMVGVDGDF